MLRISLSLELKKAISRPESLALTSEEFTNSATRDAISVERLREAIMNR